MGTLNNPAEEAPIGDRASQLLLGMVLDPNATIFQRTLRSMDLDIEMLATTYEKEIRPYLSYLHGYTPLLKQDMLAKYRTRSELWDQELRASRLVVPETWEHILSRSGVTVQTPALLVASVKLYSYGEPARLRGDRYRWLRIFLTRAGRWVVWTSSGVHATGIDHDLERVREFKTIRLAWAWMSAWNADEYSIDFRTVGVHTRRAQFKTLPLFIDASLRSVLQNTINVRRERIGKLEAALAASEARASRVDTTHHI